MDPEPRRTGRSRIPGSWSGIASSALAKRASEGLQGSQGHGGRSGGHGGQTAERCVRRRLRLHDPAALPRSRSCPRACAFSTPTTPISFWNCCPGPRDRDGLPDSIRFWKTRIEETDPDSTFAVGLIYGPSGCGKSSLVKAGLLPRLAPRHAVYVEATAGGNRSCGCSTACENAARSLPMSTLGRAAGGPCAAGQWIPAGKKVLIVLDQFEQWLHANEGRAEHANWCKPCGSATAAACSASCWCEMISGWPRAASCGNLEVRTASKGRTWRGRSLRPTHAAKVLAAFGGPTADCPEGTSSIQRNRMVPGSAVEGLAQDGKIICVRLALFADMLKGKPWTTATLSQVGGTEGLGVTFLEETFSASTAPAAHRYHQKAAQAVLRALLPEAGSDIKGSRQSYEALLASSGYAQRPGEFSDLIQILDSEIRLITPTVPASEDLNIHATDGSPTARDGLAEPDAQTKKYYQLTHDYLVPSLRDWLTHKQRETRQQGEQNSSWQSGPQCGTRSPRTGTCLRSLSLPISAR